MAPLVPEELSLRRGDATLGISWKADGAFLDTRRFALQIQSGNAGAPTLAERMRDRQTLYVLTLTPADAERLRDMQEKIAATKGTGAKRRGSLAVGFSGGCWTGQFPADQKVTVDTWIRTRSDESYSRSFPDWIWWTCSTSPASRRCRTVRHERTGALIAPLSLPFLPGSLEQHGDKT